MSALGRWGEGWSRETRAGRGAQGRGPQGRSARDGAIPGWSATGGDGGLAQVCITRAGAGAASGAGRHSQQKRRRLHTCPAAGTGVPSTAASQQAPGHVGVPWRPRTPQHFRARYPAGRERGRAGGQGRTGWRVTTWEGGTHPGGGGGRGQRSGSVAPRGERVAEEACV